MTRAPYGNAVDAPTSAARARWTRASWRRVQRCSTTARHRTRWVRGTCLQRPPPPRERQGTLASQRTCSPTRCCFRRWRSQRQHRTRSQHLATPPDTTTDCQHLSCTCGNTRRSCQQEPSARASWSPCTSTGHSSRSCQRGSSGTARSRSRSRLAWIVQECRDDTLTHRIRCDVNNTWHSLAQLESNTMLIDEAPGKETCSTHATRRPRALRRLRQQTSARQTSSNVSDELGYGCGDSTVRGSRPGFANVSGTGSLVTSSPSTCSAMTPWLRVTATCVQPSVRSGAGVVSVSSGASPPLGGARPIVENDSVASSLMLQGITCETSQARSSVVTPTQRATHSNTDSVTTIRTAPPCA
jgi:hypothetical protein